MNHLATDLSLAKVRRLISQAVSGKPEYIIETVSGRRIEISEACARGLIELETLLLEAGKHCGL